MTQRDTNPQQVTRQTLLVLVISLRPSDEINFFLYFCSSMPLSEGNSEEVHVGKISFTPSEVLGHGTAGTFVFRYVACVHVLVFPMC